MDKRQVSDNMARVTDTQGTIAAYVWDYAGKMDLIRLFWEARPPLMRCRLARPRERVCETVYTSVSRRWSTRPSRCSRLGNPRVCPSKVDEGY
jgi:hypothetical protein